MGKDKNWMKRREEKRLLSTLITKLTVEEETVAFKEMKQMSHESIRTAPALAQQIFNRWQND